MGVFLGCFIKDLEERLGFVGQGMGNFRGPFMLVPKLFFHEASPFSSFRNIVKNFLRRGKTCGVSFREGS
jgi:hypothetical protein